MYADDTILSCCVDTIQSNNIDKVINEELSKVNNWLVTNKLSLNFNKTKYMQFHKAPNHVPHLHLQINNNETSRVDTFNFLYLNSMTYTKLLIFYHELLNNNTSSNFLNFKPTISKANERYIIRSPKYILPSHNHEYIKLTCRYQLPSVLNQYNANGNNAENNMDHIASPNPIKTVNTKSLKQ